MINTIFNNTDKKMQKCVNILQTNLNSIRTDRINPYLLDNIKINHNNKITPLTKLASIVIEDSQTLAINTFDRSLISIIKKTILTSNLDLNPYIKNGIIYIKFPPLTEERRLNLKKIIKHEIENSKICLRNLRRDANDKIKILIKKKKISKDEEYILQENIQKLFNQWIKKLDKIFLEKESELMKI